MNLTMAASTTPIRKLKEISSGHDLYCSLDNLAQSYNIKQTKMVRFEHKGQMIPNLYVYVESSSPEIQIADELPKRQNILAGNF